MKARLSDFLRFVSLELKGFDAASIRAAKRDQGRTHARATSLDDSSYAESSVSSASLATGAETLDPGLNVELKLENIARSSIDAVDNGNEAGYEDICDSIPQAVTTISHLAIRFVTYIARELRYLARSGISKPEAGHLDTARSRYSVTPTEICGCVRFMVLLATIWMFSFIDTSKVYHNIKAQPVMKLYVIFNMLEIFERLCRSFTRDMMDSLIRTTIRIFVLHFAEHEVQTTPEPPPVEKKPTSKKKHIFKKKKSSKDSFGSAESALSGSEGTPDELQRDPTWFSTDDAKPAKRPKAGRMAGSETVAKRRSYAPLGSLPLTANESVLNSSRKYSEAYNVYYKFALLYVSVVLTLAFHSFLHLVRVLSLNIAINSPESTMFLLLITNNFAEIKSTVFKKYDNVSLFAIFASDAVERCYLVFDAVLVILKMSTSRRQLRSYVTVFTWLLVVYVFEIMIDLMKHGYLLKFNKIRSQTFEEYNWTLVSDCLVARSRHNRDRLTAAKFAVPCEGVFSFSHVSSRRLGFMASPIVTLIVCSLPKLAGCLSAQTFAVAVLTWLALLLLKVSTSILLTAYSVKNRSRIYSLDTSYYTIGSL